MEQFSFDIQSSEGNTVRLIFVSVFFLTYMFWLLPTKCIMQISYINSCDIFDHQPWTSTNKLFPNSLSSIHDNRVNGSDLWCLWYMQIICITCMKLSDELGINLADNKSIKLNFNERTYSSLREFFTWFYVQDQAMSVWGEADFPCISLATGVSAMHKLR